MKQQLQQPHPPDELLCSHMIRQTVTVMWKAKTQAQPHANSNSLPHHLVTALDDTHGKQPTYATPTGSDKKRSAMVCGLFSELNPQASSHVFLEWPKQQRHHEDHYSQRKYSRIREC